MPFYGLFPTFRIRRVCRFLILFNSCTVVVCTSNIICIYAYSCVCAYVRDHISARLSFFFFLFFFFFFWQRKVVVFCSFLKYFVFWRKHDQSLLFFSFVVIFCVQRIWAVGFCLGSNANQFIILKIWLIVSYNFFPFFYLVSIFVFSSSRCFIFFYFIVLIKQICWFVFLKMNAKMVAFFCLNSLRLSRRNLRFIYYMLFCYCCIFKRLTNLPLWLGEFHSVSDEDLIDFE